jgi:hypothetical protein
VPFNLIHRLSPRYSAPSAFILFFSLSVPCASAVNTRAEAASTIPPVEQAQFRTIQIEQGGGGGCLVRLLWLFAAGLVLVAAILSIVLIPVILAVSFVVTAVWSLVSGGRLPWRPRAEGEPLTRDPDRRCPSCGFDLRGHGERGACPECNTVFGFDADIRHKSVQALQIPAPDSPPPPASGR